MKFPLYCTFFISILRFFDFYFALFFISILRFDVSYLLRLLFR